MIDQNKPLGSRTLPIVVTTVLEKKKDCPKLQEATELPLRPMLTPRLSAVTISSIKSSKEDSEKSLQCNVELRPSDSMSCKYYVSTSSGISLTYTEASALLSTAKLLSLEQYVTITKKIRPLWSPFYLQVSIIRPYLRFFFREQV